MPISARVLVLDTNVFLRRMAFWEMAETFVTTPGVMAEVCDEESKLWIGNLPVVVSVSTPSKVSVGRVRAFARVTGDLASLSEEDIEVIALGLDLDVAAHGTDDHIRLEPSFKNPTSTKVFTTEKHIASTAPLGSYGDNKQYRDMNGQHRQKRRVGNVSIDMEQKYAEYRAMLDDDMLQLLRTRGPSARNETTAYTENPHEWIDVISREPVEQASPDCGQHASPDRIGQDVPTVLEAKVDNFIIEGDAVAPYAEDDWITSETLMDDTLATVRENVEPVPVAICTADYSMQNVIMQMNLRLVSPQGIIKEIKRYVGKCSACLAISPVLGSSFCKKCGNQTMMKVAMYIREDGIATFSTGIKHFNLRGTVFSLPCFASKKYLGRAGRRTIVPVSSAKDPNADYILSLQGKGNISKNITGVQHFTADIKGPAPTKGAAVTIPHFLKKNPNEAKRGKKKYSHHL